MRSGIYVVDHPQRDLPSLIWWCLKSKFHYKDKIWLIPTKELTYLTIYKIKPQFIVWNFARPANTRIMKYAKINGVINIIHETEGIPYDLERYFSNLTNDQIKYIDEIWCWGESQTKPIKKRLNGISKPPRVLNTGSIRYEYIKTLPKVDTSKNKKSFLWNTNYAAIDPRYQSVGKELSQAVYIEKTLDIDYFLEVFAEMAANRENASNKITQIIKNIEAINLTIRPHPFESDRYYRSKFEGYNVNYSTETDIHQDDLNEYSCVFHSGCQTTLDAYLRGVPSFRLEDKHINIWSYVSLEMPKDSLKEKITNPDFIKISLEKQKDLFKLHKIDNLLSNISEEGVNTSKSCLNELVSLSFNYPIYKITNKLFISMYYFAKGIKDKLKKKDISINTNLQTKAISTKLIQKKLIDLSNMDCWYENGFTVINPDSRRRINNESNN